MAQPLEPKPKPDSDDPPVFPPRKPPLPLIPFPVDPLTGLPKIVFWKPRLPRSMEGRGKWELFFEKICKVKLRRDGQYLDLRHSLSILLGYVIKVDAQGQRKIQNAAKDNKAALQSSQVQHSGIARRLAGKASILTIEEKKQRPEIPGPDNAFMNVSRLYKSLQDDIGAEIKCPDNGNGQEAYWAEFNRCGRTWVLSASQRAKQSMFVRAMIVVALRFYRAVGIAGAPDVGHQRAINCVATLAARCGASLGLRPAVKRVKEILDMQPQLAEYLKSRWIHFEESIQEMLIAAIQKASAVYPLKSKKKKSSH